MTVSDLIATLSSYPADARVTLLYPDKQWLLRGGREEVDRWQRAELNGREFPAGSASQGKPDRRPS